MGSNLKKLKISDQALDLIVLNLSKYLKKYNIKSLQIILKTCKKSHIFNLVRLLSYYGFVVLRIIERLSNAHNGVRKARKRRV